MNIHDARARFTEATIREEFLKLLEEKPASKITVKELCEKSTINRATFYKHYADVYALLEAMENEMIDRLMYLVKPERFSNVQDMLTEMLRTTKEFGAPWLIIFTPNGDPGLISKLLDICYKAGFPSFKNSLIELDAFQQEYIYTFIAQGSSGIISSWITNGMKEAPEDIAVLISRLCDYLLQPLKRQKKI